MEKSISSIPGAKFFRSNIVVLIIVILIGFYFQFNQGLTEKAEKIAKQHILTDIKYSLAMMHYEYSIKRKSNNLIKFHQKNPFVPLSIYRKAPKNYAGIIDTKLAKENQWFYDGSLKMAAYKKGEEIQYWQMVYIVKNKIGRLELQEIK